MRARKRLAIWVICVLMAAVPLAGFAEDALEARPLPIDFSKGSVPRQEGYIGEWEYRDPTIHVKVEAGREKECDYWVADIRIGHASQLRTAAAEDFESGMVLPGETIAKRMNAVLAINGDYFSYRSLGYILRQGTLYRDNISGRRDILMIDEDGDFHFLRKPGKRGGVSEIDGKKVINAFFFGPVLVENGEVNTDWSCDEMAFGDCCQRMAIGQVGPLHYKVVCVGPPARGSTGMKIRQFAQFVKDLGIDNAYNLDGGDSTVLVFRNQKVNDRENPNTRNLADIIYFASSADADLR